MGEIGRLQGARGSGGRQDDKKIERECERDHSSYLNYKETRLGVFKYRTETTIESTGQKEEEEKKRTRSRDKALTDARKQKKRPKDWKGP